MTRGPGRIERAIEAVLRDADRSYSIDELAQIAYGTAEVEKKHRVAVLRALRGVGRRVPLWYWITDQRRGSYFVTRLDSVRSYTHGLLRRRWWSAPRSLQQVDEIMADPEIRLLMEPGGAWWTDVEFNKVKYEFQQLKKAMGIPDKGGVEDTLANAPLLALIEQWNDLHSHRVSLGRWGYDPRWLSEVLGRFERPGSPVFEYAMKRRQWFPRSKGLPEGGRKA